MKSALKIRTTQELSPMRRYWRLIVLALFIVLFNSGIASAIAEQSLEYPVKGAYLFKFGSYVEWPRAAFADATAPFVIGILGEDPFGAELDNIVQGRTVQGRPVVVKRYKTAEDAQNAHILYISPTKSETIEQALAKLRGKSVLTVSDDSRASAGIVNFIILDNKVRFEIDPDQANRVGLKVSSKLLNIAKIVDNEKR